VSFSVLFRSECKLILHCLSCNVKTKQNKTKAKLSKKSKYKRRSNHFVYDVLSDVHAYTVCVFSPLLYMNQVPEKNVSWSVAVYNKTVSSQCNLISQIEQVQDNYYHPSI
jgi:hypothetical protein